MSVSLFLFYKEVHLYSPFQISCISNIVLYFSVCLTSFSVIISRPIHVAAEWRYFFFFMANVVRSSVNGRLDCFPVLAVVSSVALNTGMRLSFRIITLAVFGTRWLKALNALGLTSLVWILAVSPGTWWGTLAMAFSAAIAGLRATYLSNSCNNSMGCCVENTDHSTSPCETSITISSSSYAYYN